MVPEVRDDPHEPIAHASESRENCSLDADLAWDPEFPGIPSQKTRGIPYFFIVGLRSRPAPCFSDTFAIVPPPIFDRYSTEVAGDGV